jgi:hypothetical protein
MIGAMLVACVSSQMAQAQSPPAQPASPPDTLTRLSPMDVFALQYAADPRISPDGKRVVYVRRSATW